ncbi:MAG TPA: prepilin-type N-terminal cleavage/methylation domain-containing protein [Hydrogenothermaceae bacterium]|nr:prepilin-type N-terminal cleavage/methylation domain-containing protein [Hydrogenothermaceae bacterium]
MKEKGFTLIEVLISITILSIIIGVAVYSLKYTLNIIEYLKTPSTQETINISYLRDSISSLFFFLSEDVKTKDIQKRFKFFFYGDNNKLTYITTKSVFHERDTLYIEHIYFKENKVYIKEHPVYSPKVDYKNPKIPKNTKSFVLLKDIQNFKITYYADGWQDKIKNKIPKLIKISYTNKKGRKLELIFKPKSDFYFKKQLNIYYFNPM